MSLNTTLIINRMSFIFIQKTTRFTKKVLNPPSLYFPLSGIMRFELKLKNFSLVLDASLTDILVLIGIRQTFRIFLV